MSFFAIFYESGKRRYKMSCRNFFCNFFSANSFHRNFWEIHNFDVLDFTEDLDLTPEGRFWTLRRVWTLLLVKTNMSLSTDSADSGVTAEYRVKKRRFITKILIDFLVFSSHLGLHSFFFIRINFIRILRLRFSLENNRSIVKDIKNITRLGRKNTILIKKSVNNYKNSRN